MRVLHLVLHLRRLVHLTILNLNGNPLNPVLQELWETPAAGTSRQQQMPLSGRQAVAAAASRVQDRTQAVLQHLLEQQVCCHWHSSLLVGETRHVRCQQSYKPTADIRVTLHGFIPAINAHATMHATFPPQDSATVLQVKQAKVQLLQQASTQQILKLLYVADPESLANCASIAASTGLSSSLSQRIQQAQAATADMQAALEAAKRLQDSSIVTDTQAESGAAHEQLSAALRQFESLCKPGAVNDCVLPAHVVHAGQAATPIARLGMLVHSTSAGAKAVLAAC
jgi:hypothetical protein